MVNTQCYKVVIPVQLYSPIKIHFSKDNEIWSVNNLKNIVRFYSNLIGLFEVVKLTNFTFTKMNIQFTIKKYTQLDSGIPRKIVT